MTARLQKLKQAILKLANVEQNLSKLDMVAGFIQPPVPLALPPGLTRDLLHQVLQKVRLVVDRQRPSLNQAHALIGIVIELKTGQFQMEPEPVIDTVLKDRHEKELAFLNEGTACHEMDQGFSAYVVRTGCQVLCKVPEVGDLLLREASVVDDLALLVDIVAEIAHVFKGRAIAIHDGLLVQTCPIEEQNGEVWVVTRGLVHD